MAVEFLSVVRPPVVAALPSGVKGDCAVLSSDGHLYTYDGTTWVDNGAAGGSGSFSVKSVQANLGATPSWRGKFTITDAAISAASKVMIEQAPGPYTGKGTLADEAEMDAIIATAEAQSGQAVVRWQTTTGCLPTLTPPVMEPRNATVPLTSSELRRQGPYTTRRAGLVKGFVRFFYTIG